MIQSFHGLERSLSNILEIGLLLSNKRMVIFLEQKKKSISQQTQKGHKIIINSTTRGSNIFSIKSESFSPKEFVITNLKIVSEDNFYLGLVRLT